MPNYQERAIYLDESDNVCHFGSQCDEINLVFNLDGAQTIKITAGGSTRCRQWVVRDATAIMPAKEWGFVSPEDHDDIGFQEETSYHHIFGVLHMIIQKSTVVNPAKIRGKLYNCVIFGDGKVQHFGVHFEDKPPATIYLKCDSLGLSEEPQLQNS